MAAAVAPALGTGFARTDPSRRECQALSGTARMVLNDERPCSRPVPHLIEGVWTWQTDHGEGGLPDYIRGHFKLESLPAGGLEHNAAPDRPKACLAMGSRVHAYLQVGWLAVFQPDSRWSAGPHGHTKPR